MPASIYISARSIKRVVDLQNKWQLEQDRRETQRERTNGRDGCG